MLKYCQFGNYHCNKYINTESDLYRQENVMFEISVLILSEIKSQEAGLMCSKQNTNTNISCLELSTVLL